MGDLLFSNCGDPTTAAWSAGVGLESHETDYYKGKKETSIDPLSTLLLLGSTTTLFPEVRKKI